jgi:predicted amidophosphoribosyltransferase
VLCPLCRTGWEAATVEAEAQAAQDAARGLVYLTFYHSGRTDGVPEQLIYHLKHKGNPRAFRFVARRLAARLNEALPKLPTRCPDLNPEGGGEAPRPPLFTYPPRRPSAVRRDGFDQAERLAKALASACGGDSARLVRRTRRPAREQKNLDAEARAVNAAASYRLTRTAPEHVRGRVVVLCDDVCTTGATLESCARLLVEAGTALVVLVTVARTNYT